MIENNWLHELNQWVFTYATNLYWSLAILLLYIIITRLALPRIQKNVDKSNLKPEATPKAYHTVRLLAATMTLAILLIVWGIDFSVLLVLSTSLITLTGVALFASWSLLSNITSYFILLFQNSYRRGNFVRIIDADNYVEGHIADVNLFNTKLITEDREIIICPNNLILNRPTVVNPRERWSKMGKVSDKSEIKSKGNE